MWKAFKAKIVTIIFYLFVHLIIRENNLSKLFKTNERMPKRNLQNEKKSVISFSPEKKEEIFYLKIQSN